MRSAMVPTTSIRSKSWIAWMMEDRVMELPASSWEVGLTNSSYRPDQPTCAQVCARVMPLTIM